MTISGWSEQYDIIREEFGYDYNLDLESATLLDSMLKDVDYTSKLYHMIHEKTVFVLGAGPSLDSTIHIANKYSATKIVADGAAQAIIHNDMRAEIIVTDLDGDSDSLKTAAQQGSLMVVHAHGDNIDKLNMISDFPNCIGTTQTNSVGKVDNFGGFSDGDRCVFLASHFGAKNIILFGMDFGNEIGKYSKEMVQNKELKLKKLRRGEILLKWLAGKTSSTIYTMSNMPPYFQRLNITQLDKLFSR